LIECQLCLKDNDGQRCKSISLSSGSELISLSVRDSCSQILEA
jgi:hypothetical protein